MLISKTQIQTRYLKPKIQILKTWNRNIIKKVNQEDKNIFKTY